MFKFQMGRKAPYEKQYTFRDLLQFVSSFPLSRRIVKCEVWEREGSTMKWTMLFAGNFRDMSMSWSFQTDNPFLIQLFLDHVKWNEKGVFVNYEEHYRKPLPFTFSKSNAKKRRY